MSVKRVNSAASPERVADEYAKWTKEIWPELNEEVLPRTAEEARKRFVAAHRLQEFRSGPASTAVSHKRFEAKPSVEHGSRINSNWPLFEPETIRRALKVLISEQGSIDKVGQLVSSVATGSPSSERGFDRPPNACVLLQQRAEVLEAIFADLQALEAGETDLNSRRRVQLAVIRPIMKFLDEGPRLIAQCREVANR